MIAPNDPDYFFARLAVDRAKRCPKSPGASNPPPLVGVVLAKDGALLGWAAKGYGGAYMLNGIVEPFAVANSDHAEQSLLEKFGPDDLRGATAYVTLEPCTHRKNGRPCADLLIQYGISKVFVGNCDPHPDIGALAWRRFREASVAVKDFPGELRNEARRDNADFFAKFHWSIKEDGAASFNYSENGGERVLGPPGKEFRTRWTNRGNGSIYALDYKNNVCLAKNCTTFDQVDDPGRWLEDIHYTKPVNEGEIVIFRNEHGFALIKVLSVRARSADENPKLHFAFQLRYR